MILCYAQNDNINICEFILLILEDINVGRGATHPCSIILINKCRSYKRGIKMTIRIEDDNYGR